MTAAAAEMPSPAWPEGALYYSERGLYPFQADHVAQAYLGMIDGSQPEWMFAWDTGLGKSHAAMQLAALAFEDERADFVVLVCEKNKLREWLEDFKRFTRLDARIHHGPNRKKKLVKLGVPQVLITTYETGKADFVQMSKTTRGRRVFEPSELTTSFHRTRRPMVFFDEADKLSNRTAATYRAYEYLLKHLRTTQVNMPVLMMTATSIRKDYENAFNQLRLLRPAAMPLIKEFEGYFVRGRDIYGKARYFDHRTEEFAAICQPLMLPKSKTDSDVIEQFPAMTEEALWVDMEGPQKRLYDICAEFDHPGLLTALKQICGHPGALVHTAKHGTSKIAKMLVEELGEEWLLNCPSAKTEALVAYLEPIVKQQGDKAVVFSFFGPSVLPLLREALEGRGIACHSFSDPEQLQSFKSAPGGRVLLSSDAGARGVNLPEASYLVEYDIAGTYGLRTQRLNRISRIGAGGPTATVRTMLTRESVEIGLMFSMLRGNVQSDELLGRGETGEAYMTAGMRRALLTEDMR